VRVKNSITLKFRSFALVGEQSRHTVFTVCDPVLIFFLRVTRWLMPQAAARDLAPSSCFDIEAVYYTSFMIHEKP